MANAHAPFHPIIYVRGYALVRARAGRNHGRPLLRLQPGLHRVQRHGRQEPAGEEVVFESPVLRLMSDYGYADIYDNGLDIMDGEWEAIGALRIIYHFYGQAWPCWCWEAAGYFTLRGLSELILRVRDLAPAPTPTTSWRPGLSAFLVRHSAGRPWYTARSLAEPEPP